LRSVFSRARRVERCGVPRKPKAPPPTAPQGSYAEWRGRAAVVLERRGISAGVMREREWRRLFIAGVTPETAADRAETENHNRRDLRSVMSRPPFDAPDFGLFILKLGWDCAARSIHIRRCSWRQQCLLPGMDGLLRRWRAGASSAFATARGAGLVTRSSRPDLDAVLRLICLIVFQSWPPPKAHPPIPRRDCGSAARGERPIRAEWRAMPTGAPHAPR